MNYPVIFFDLDNTLFEFSKAAHRSLTKTFSHFKLMVEKAHFDLYEQINHEVWLSFERKEITAVELRPLRFERFLSAIGEFRDAGEMSHFYLLDLSRSDDVLEGARELVIELKRKGHRLALVTNGLKEVQRPRIAKADMGHYFEAIVVSDEIGVAKPDAAFFEYAFAEMGQPEKGDVLMVGDSLSSDIQGGNGFGLATCWFNPKKAANLTPHQPTFEISELGMLHEIV